MEQVDGVRLREFRQVKQEIRGSNQYLVVGIDSPYVILQQQQNDAYSNQPLSITGWIYECNYHQASLSLSFLIFEGTSKAPLFQKHSKCWTDNKKKYFGDYRARTKVVIIGISNFNSYKEAIGAVHFLPVK